MPGPSAKVGVPFAHWLSCMELKEQLREWSLKDIPGVHPK